MFPSASLRICLFKLLRQQREETRGKGIKVEGKKLKSQPFYLTGRMKPRDPSMLLSIASRQEGFSVRSRSCCFLRWFTYCFCYAWTADINAIATNFCFSDSSFFKLLPRNGYTLFDGYQRASPDKRSVRFFNIFIRFDSFNSEIFPELAY